MRNVDRSGKLVARGWSGRVFGWIVGTLPLLLDHLKPVRVSLLVIVLGGFIAVGVDQVAELFLIAVWIDRSTGRYAALLAGSALAGLAIWYGARNAYRLLYPRWPALQDHRGAGLRDWLPRLLGAAIPLLVLLAYVLALRTVPHGQCKIAAGCDQRIWRPVGLLIESLLLIVFFVTRRRLLKALPLIAGAAPVSPRPSAERRVARVRDLGRTRLFWYALVLGLNVLAVALIAWRPEALNRVGSLAILLIAAAFFCFSGGLLCMLADRRGWPLLSSLLLASGLFHLFHLNDNHRVRQYPGMSTHQGPGAAETETRPSFEAYANAWLDDRCVGRSPCPVVLVSSEGGGIRGAAWTALVLSRLTEQVGQGGSGGSRFAKHLFAGSGVSGGSLGLATYAALLHRPVPGATLEKRAQGLLSHDFLAPTLANMFFVDFTQRWLPGAWFDDRSRALTRAWERAGEQQETDALTQPLADLYRTPQGDLDTSMPALFLNSTAVAEGRRVIQHPFRAMATPQQQPWTAAFDGATWLGPRVPLSEVVLNSARFTYLNPAGTLETAVPVGATPPVPAQLQLVDGGYFENSGATTLLEVMQRLRAVAAQRGQTLRFIVLHISNDPDAPDFVQAHDRAKPLPFYSTACPVSEAAAPRPSGEASAPMQALLNTRGARGEYARVQLMRALQPNQADPASGDMLWHFRLCPGEYPIPLGWTMSAPVFGELQRQLEHNYPLDAMVRALDEQLAPSR
jgi:hypothetical protein